MNRTRVGWLTLCAALGVCCAGCNGDRSDPKAEAPPPYRVERVQDRNVFPVEHPERFQLVAAVEHSATPSLQVTGTVSVDIARAVPVISLATGRIVEIDARLGDTVRKGQLMLKVQSADIAGAFSDYQKAVADEKLAATQLERAKFLYDRGAIAQNDLQMAENTEDKARVDVANTAEKLRVLGHNSLDKPVTGIVELRAPISGVVTDQEVTNAAGVQGLASPNPFTISDLSSVWVLCDVYENDLASVRLGEKADIRLNAYPDKFLTGTISNIGPILDPSIRTAKVRIEMQNPGFMRPGMFVSATFHGQQQEKRAAVPATAILHLHDRDWVFVPLDARTFRRTEVAGGNMLPDGLQEIQSGLAPGQRVVANALEFQMTVGQ